MDYKFPLVGAHKAVMTIQKYMSIKHGFPWTWVRQGWNVQGSDSQAIGEGYVNASWQCGIFPSNTQVQILHTTLTHRNSYNAILSHSWAHCHTYTHVQTSSWHYWEALSDKITWSHGQHFFVTNLFVLLLDVNAVPLLNPSWCSTQWDHQSTSFKLWKAS